MSAMKKMQFKIRASQTSKIPYQLIVGDKEMEDGTVNVRRYGQKETQTVSVDDFVQAILADIANKSRDWEIRDKTWDKILAT